MMGCWRQSGVRPWGHLPGKAVKTSHTYDNTDGPETVCAKTENQVYGINKHLQTFFK